jgi:hypothetical protein
MEPTSNSFFYDVKDKFLEALACDSTSWLGRKITWLKDSVTEILNIFLSFLFPNNETTSSGNGPTEQKIPTTVDQNSNSPTGTSADVADTKSGTPLANPANQDTSVPLQAPVVSTVNVKEAQPLGTPYKGKIALAKNIGGLVGPLKRLEEIPHQLGLLDWTFEDGSKLPLKPETLLLSFHIYDYSKEFKDLAGEEWSFFLPAFLFENCSEGDVIRLKYKGEHVELVVNQNTFMENRDSLDKYKRPESNDFQEIFKCTFNQVSKKIESGDLGFSGILFPRKIAQSDEGYTLKHSGVLFHSICGDDGKCQVTIAETQKLRSLKNQNEDQMLVHPRQTLYIDRVPNTVTVRSILKVAGIKKQVDIVVNEKFLCFFASEMLFSEPGEISKVQVRYFHVIKWREYFENISTEQMQSKVANAIATLADGVFTIDI